MICNKRVVLVVAADFVESIQLKIRAFLDIAVQAFSGPSSILLGLVLSDLPGQRFTFLGYLDKEPKNREREIKELQCNSKAQEAPQIFIEAPYRNKHLLESLLKNLRVMIRNYVWRGI